MFTSMFHNILPCLHIHSKQFNAVQVREVHNRLEVLQLVKPILSKFKKNIYVGTLPERQKSQILPLICKFKNS